MAGAAYYASYFIYLQVTDSLCLIGFQSSLQKESGGGIGVQSCRLMEMEKSCVLETFYN